MRLLAADREMTGSNTGHSGRNFFFVCSRGGGMKEQSLTKVTRERLSNKSKQLEISVYLNCTHDVVNVTI